MAAQTKASNVPKVTIGMCIKNSGVMVRKALDSILCQDYSLSSMELVVVDGNSQDRTIDILKGRMTNTELKVKIFSENSGLATARQMVVDKAVGDYVVWVDADMILSRSYVLRQVAFMDGHPEVGIAAGKYSVHMGQGMAADLENIVYAVDSAFGEIGASKFGYLPGTEGSIFRIKAIRQIGGFDVSMDGAAEDTEVAYRMIFKGWKIAITQEMFAESTRASWLSLWRQYMWYGRGGHFIFHKDCNMISLLKMTPMAGFYAGVIRCPKAYLLVHKRFVFFLPFHYAYKRVAWFIGFITAHSGGYGHSDKVKKI